MPKARCKHAGCPRSAANYGVCVVHLVPPRGPATNLRPGGAHPSKRHALITDAAKRAVADEVTQ